MALHVHSMFYMYLARSVAVRCTVVYRQKKKKAAELNSPLMHILAEVASTQALQSSSESTPNCQQ